MNTQEKQETADSGRQLVTFKVQTQYYAVPIESVIEMTLLGDLESIVGAPEWIRGMMQLRNSVIPVLSLRSRLGLLDLRDEIAELVAQLQQRKKDHITWLHTLEECCAKGTRFDLQKDPTQCAFGLWFYSFSTEDAVLGNQIAKFEEPHNRIHALADHCLGLASKGNQIAAQNEIDLAREVDLSDMIRLFGVTIRDINARSRQMVIVLKGETENLGLTVDRIDSVTTVHDDQIDPRPLKDLDADDATADLIVESVVRTDDERGLIQILDVDKVFASAGIRHNMIGADLVNYEQPDDTEPTAEAQLG